MPLEVGRVREKMRLRVDTQYLKPAHANWKGEWVLVMHSVFDGNHICFIDENGKGTFNLDEAQRYDAEHALINAGQYNSIPWALDLVERVQSRVILAADINERAMTTAAGIRKPKAERRSRAQGYHQYNCVKCGQFVHSFNPYEENPQCELHKCRGEL